ncbi:hypothetical protein [Persephonella sp.]
MATVKIELEEQEFEKLRKEICKKGFKSVEEYIKFLVRNKKHLPDIFYKGSSKKYRVSNSSREQLYDRC